MKASCSPARVLSQCRGVAAALLFGVGPWAFATTTAPSSSPSSPPANAYIEQPQQSTTITTYSSFPSYSGGSYYPGWSGSYGGWSNPGFITGYSYTYQPRRYFFPPNPPALGEPYARNLTKSASRVLSRIPVSLSDYVNEPFYAPLSPFLFEENLSKKREQMLNDYKSAKATLLAELQAKLDAVEALKPEAREAQLAEFAREQSPRIAAVEATADAIRKDLTQWHLFSDSSDWNEGRDWRLGDDTRWESTLDDAKVMRGASYFQEGLNPAQRRLLREYAMELDDSGRGLGTEIALDVHGPYFYFSPETSRVRLPANLPAELQAKISSYTMLKATLKKQLRDTLYKEDRRWFDSKRAAALRQLADQQAPQLAQLDVLAEEIRRGLAPIPNPARPAPVKQVLPPALANRISSYIHTKAVYQRAMTDRAVALRRQFPTSRVEYVKTGEGFSIQLVANRRLSTSEKQQFEETMAKLEPFNQTEVAEYARLSREKEAIREALIQSTGNLAPLLSTRVVDLFLREYNGVLATQELWAQYHDYEVAVLQPGLSPEQRRLLYDAALVKLDLQIPRYTY